MATQELMEMIRTNREHPVTCWDCSRTHTCIEIRTLKKLQLSSSEYTYRRCRISMVPAWNCRIKYQFLFWRKWELEYLHNIKTSQTLIVCSPFSLNVNANAKLKFLFTILTKHYPNVVTEHMFIGHLAHIGSYIGYMCNCIHGYEHVCIILYIILVN